METKYARDELFLQNDNERYSLGADRWPIITLRYTHGFSGVFNSDFTYDKLKLTINKKIKTGPLGKGYLTLTAENIFNTHMNPYKISLTQIYFFKRMLKLMEYKNIPVIFYYPVVANALKTKMEKGGILDDFNHQTSTLILKSKENKNTKFYIVDPSINKNWTCRDFVDALHLSGACFSNLLPILFPVELRN